MGQIGSVDEVIRFIEGSRPNLFHNELQSLREGPPGYTVVPPSTRVPVEGWQDLTPIEASLPKTYADPMVFRWRGHSATVTPTWCSSEEYDADAPPGRLIHETVVYEVGRGTHRLYVVRAPLVDRIEELVLLAGPMPDLALEYHIAPDRSVTEVKQTPGGWVELWSGDRPYLRLNSIEALDAQGKTFHGTWIVERVGSGFVARVKLDLADARFPVLIDPGWSSTGALAIARTRFSTTTLASGRVLLAGGIDNSASRLTQCELYDPATGTWSATGSLSTGRQFHTGTLLSSGRVLVAGGNNNNNFSIATCEVYDPAAGTWSSTGPLLRPRERHTATRLSNGRVLVAAGVDGATQLYSCDLFNEASGTWSATGLLAEWRWDHTATLLPSGQVLIAGGFGGAAGTTLSSCELYSAASGTWTATGSLVERRYGHSATLLSSGRVLVAGGDDVGIYRSSAELFNPAAGTWTSTGSLAAARGYHTATLLNSGNVLVAGGSNGGSLASCEVYETGTGSWTSTPPMSIPRVFHSGTLLSTGRVLVAGGFTTACELYDETSPDTTPPTVPPPLTPADGAFLSTARPTLTWGASTDDTAVANYDVQVASDASFTSFEYSATVVATSSATSTLSDGLHFWRFRARDAAGNTSSWSAVRSFTTDIVPPTVPVLASPADGALIPSASVTLSWSASTDGTAVTGYDVQVAANTQFSPLQFSATTASTSSTTGALAQGGHSWRVRAIDAAGNVSAWSAVPGFTTDTVAPTVPAPASPANGGAVSTSAVALAWGASSDAGSGVREYDAEVASDAAFTAVEWSVTQASTGATTVALPDGLHYWRVRARDNIGFVSAWSATWSFTADTLPPATGPLTTAPQDGATSTTPRPPLSWTAVSDASGVTYEVEVAAANPIVAPLEASIAGLATTQWVPPRLADGTHYWHVRAVDGAGNAGAWSSTMSFVVQGAKGFYVGLGTGGRGEIAPFQGGGASYAARPLYTIPWASYDSAVGETRPAAGDLDGDGRPEVVVGLGRYPASGGWLAVLSDSGSAFSLVRWIRLTWAAYNAANGETYPVCGDIDGDGRDEIVVGLGTYTASGGWFAVYDDGTTGNAFLTWKRVDWPQYDAYDGQTRPAVGDMDGDGASEVLIGLGKYPGQGGYIYTYASRTIASTGRLRMNWTPYNSANGETWPACGDVDGDGRDEVCIGLGSYPTNGGWVQYLDDAAAGYAPIGWLRVNWSSYNAASGETRPSVGHLILGASGQQTVVGFGKEVGARGWVGIYDRAPGFAFLGWKQISDAAYGSANGETRPSVGR